MGGVRKHRNSNNFVFGVVANMLTSSTSRVVLFKQSQDKKKGLSVATRGKMAYLAKALSDETYIVD